MEIRNDLMSIQRRLYRCLKKSSACFNWGCVVFVFTLGKICLMSNFFGDNIVFSRLAVYFIALPVIIIFRIICFIFLLKGKEYALKAMGAYVVCLKIELYCFSDYWGYVCSFLPKSSGKKKISSV